METKMSRILVVDDEQAITTLLQFNLEQNGYHVTIAADGATALQLVEQEQYDAVLLDLMLPEVDGMSVLRQMRENSIRIPVILVTAKGDEFDRIFGLEIGADDYITKPFSPREVIARLKAVLRRYHEQSTNRNDQVGYLTIQDLVIDDARKVVKKDGQTVILTPREYELLLYFAKRIGRVIDRETILTSVWGYDFTGQSRMVDMHISNLREKIENDPKHPTILKTVRGFGYTMSDAL